MNKLEVLKALYEASKVEGRGRFCPRRGTYFIVEVYKGICYGKEALMAKARWKQGVDDGYLHQFIVDVQLESFKESESSDKQAWSGREILVKSAQYEKGKVEFAIVWELVPENKISVSDLNNMLQSGSFESVDSLLDSTGGLDIHGEELDYGGDDWTEY